MTSAAHPTPHRPEGDPVDPAAARAVRRATAANVVGWTAHTTFMYYLAPIALRAGGIEGRDALIFATTAVAMGLTVVPAGRLADRIARRHVLRGGLALLGVAYLALIPAPRLDILMAGTIATGMGLALLFVSFNSYVADLLSANARGAAYGRAGASSVLAGALGPFIAAAVFRAMSDDVLGLRVNAAVFGVAALAALLVTLSLPGVRAVEPTSTSRGHWHEAARAAGPIAFVYLLMGAGYGMTAPYFTVYFLDHVGLANSTWGILLGAGTIASAAGSFLAGEAGRRLPRDTLAVLGQGGLLLASALFLIPTGLPLLALGFLGRSFFSTTTAPVMATILMQRARPGRRAEAQGYVSLAWNVGWTAGAASGGIILVTLGGALFPAGATLAIIGVGGGVAALRMRKSVPAVTNESAPPE